MVRLIRRRRLVAPLALLIGLAALGGAALSLRLLAGRGVSAAALWDSPDGALPEAPLPIDAPPGPLRLLFLGTSLTHEEPWPDAVTAALAACRGAPVEVETIAHPGANAAWGAEALEAALAPKLAETDEEAGDSVRPDLVFIEFAANDASLFRGLSLAESRRRHEGMLALVKAAGARAVLMIMNPVRGSERLERPGLGAYQRLYRRLAGGRAALIDVGAAWEAQSAEAVDALVPDGLHPTPEAGRRVTAPAILAALEPALCPASAS